MASSSDLKFIIPLHAQLFTTAFEKLSQNDYLLTTAICCQIKERSAVGLGHSFTSKKFVRYTFLTTSYHENGRDYDTSMEISLDGTKIAVWKEQYNFYMNYHRCFLKALENAESAILAALGVVGFYDKGFASPEVPAQNGSTGSDSSENKVPSNSECYSIDLESLGF